MKDQDTIYIECDCGDNNHLFKLTYADGDSDFAPHAYTSIQMHQHRPWYKRVRLAIGYIFGEESRFGHWDCTSLDLKQMKALRDWCEEAYDEMLAWSRSRSKDGSN